MSAGISHDSLIALIALYCTPRLLDYNYDSRILPLRSIGSYAVPRPSLTTANRHVVVLPQFRPIGDCVRSLPKQYASGSRDNARAR